MNSIAKYIGSNLYEFYDSISQICGLETDKQKHWSVSKNASGYWPRLVYQVDQDITVPEVSATFSEKVKSGQLPELLIANDENIRQIDPFLRQQGFYPFTAWKGMALTSLQNLTPRVLPDAIEIVKPQSVSELEQWLKIVNTELVSPLRMEESLLKSLTALPEFDAYLMQKDGIGVSTILVFESTESTGLYMIATEKSAQKQGFASLLVHHILWQHAQRSKKQVILHATQSGEPLYLKFGFQPINQFFLYRYLKSNI
jgi:hypothetical protein